MKDILCSYYTASEDITKYMVAMLDIENADVVLEPSAGNGLFIDELIKSNKKIHIDALDIDRNAIAILKEKYKDKTNIVIRETDTLFDKELDSFQNIESWLKKTDTLPDNELHLYSETSGHYSKIIGNPPYGAWQDYEKRNLLKKNIMVNM